MIFSPEPEFWDFIVNMTANLAWPVTILTLFLTFRGEIEKVLTRLSSLKLGDLHASFATELENLSDEASKLEVSSPIDDSILQQEVKIAVDNPYYAITASWREVEKHLVELDRLAYPNIKPGHGLRMHIVRRMVNESRLDPEIVRFSEKLLELKNRAVHGSKSSITSGEASEYVNLAIRTISAIEEAKKCLGTL